MDTVEPGTGLTPREKNALRDTWAVVMQDKRKNGFLFFKKFFEMFPKMQGYFKFRDVELNDLEENATFKLHAGKVFTQINNMVENLDNVPELVGIIKGVGSDHAPNGITAEAFENLRDAFLAFLVERMSATITPFQKTSWEKVMGVIVALAQDGFNSAKGTQ
ncbi:unnamed protein product [Owenia fusiformis]|nr:unnamed protein product [Owenia fusiformis]